jgi:hypothetical protein
VRYVRTGDSPEYYLQVPYNMLQGVYCGFPFRYSPTYL